MNIDLKIGSLSPPVVRDVTFEAWFHGSKIVDSAGTPAIMYHGTTNNFTKFQENSRGVHFFSPSPQWVSDYLSGEQKNLPEGSMIMPVYVSAKNPFDYENKSHINLVASRASLGSLAISQIKRGDWARLEDRTLIATIKKLGFDGLFVKENGVKNLAIFNVDQIRFRIEKPLPALCNGLAERLAKLVKKNRWIAS